jgi:para-aminobenzoate synthetase component 1
MQRADYLRLVDRARDYIAAGDVYQVNLAQRFVAPGFRSDGAELFSAWRDAYPMPFAAYVDGGEWTAVSNSPECFLTVDGCDVASFPIKGTLDHELAAAGRTLDGDPKERAEHVMIVDLERNDLGRVCEAGSVTVAALGRVQSYPLLQHMVSEVRGRLRPRVTLPELFRATFPGGSITGAPKIRAMEIIEELEPCARGLYTGTIGWSDLRGASRFNLAIRTAVLNQQGLSYHAGGGIVADSDPEREYDETLLKSETLFRALSWWGGEWAWTAPATSF